MSSYKTTISTYGKKHELNVTHQKNLRAALEQFHPRGGSLFRNSGCIGSDSLSQLFVWGPFRIITDYKALLFCLSKEKTSTTTQTGLIRWTDRLLPFDYVIEHISGTKMRLVDYICRHPVEEATKVSQSITNSVTNSYRQPSTESNVIPAEIFPSILFFDAGFISILTKADQILNCIIDALLAKDYTVIRSFEITFVILHLNSTPLTTSCF